MVDSMQPIYKYTPLVAMYVLGAILVGGYLASLLSLWTSLQLLLLGVCIGAASSVFFLRYFRRQLFSTGCAPSPFMKHFGIWVFLVPGAIAGIVLGIVAQKWDVALVQAICLFGCIIFVVNFSVLGIYVHSLERKYGRKLFMGAGGFFFDEE